MGIRRPSAAGPWPTEASSDRPGRRCRPLRRRDSGGERGAGPYRRPFRRSWRTGYLWPGRP